VSRHQRLLLVEHDYEHEQEHEQRAIPESSVAWASRPRTVLPDRSAITDRGGSVAGGEAAVLALTDKEVWHA